MQSNANYEFHGGAYKIVTWYLHFIWSHSEHKTPATITNSELQVGRETQQQQWNTTKFKRMKQQNRAEVDASKTSE